MSGSNLPPKRYPKDLEHLPQVFFCAQAAAFPLPGHVCPPEMCPPTPEWAHLSTFLCPGCRISPLRARFPLKMCPPTPEWAHQSTFLCPGGCISPPRARLPPEMCPPAPQWAHRSTFLCPGGYISPPWEHLFLDLLKRQTYFRCGWWSRMSCIHCRELIWV